MKYLSRHTILYHILYKSEGSMLLWKWHGAWFMPLEDDTLKTSKFFSFYSTRIFEILYQLNNILFLFSEHSCIYALFMSRVCENCNCFPSYMNYMDCKNSLDETKCITCLSKPKCTFQQHIECVTGQDSPDEIGKTNWMHFEVCLRPSLSQLWIYTKWKMSTRMYKIYISSENNSICWFRRKRQTERGQWIKLGIDKQNTIVYNLQSFRGLSKVKFGIQLAHII